VTGPVEIARGTASDCCCVLCGKVRVDLPVEHGCIPNLTPEQEANRLRWTDGGREWEALFERRRPDHEYGFYRRWDAQKKTAPAGMATVTPIRVSRSYVKAAVDRELATLAATRQGSRNDQLNRSSFALGQLVSAGVLAEAGTIEVLARTARSIGLPEPEIQATITSGIAAGKAQPRQGVG
jgi:hypothetical protein